MGRGPVRWEDRKTGRGLVQWYSGRECPFRSGRRDDRDAKGPVSGTSEERQTLPRRTSPFVSVYKSQIFSSTVQSSSSIIITVICLGR